MTKMKAKVCGSIELCVRESRSDNVVASSLLYLSVWNAGDICLSQSTVDVIMNLGCEIRNKTAAMTKTKAKVCGSIELCVRESSSDNVVASSLLYLTVWNSESIQSTVDDITILAHTIADSKNHSASSSSVGVSLFNNADLLYLLFSAMQPMLLMLQLYMVGQKSKLAYFCNNFVYWHTYTRGNLQLEDI